MRFAAFAGRFQLEGGVMKKNILWGVGFAGLLAVGLSAQTQQPQDQKDQQKSTASMDDRKVTVQGCLERDYLYSPSTTGAATQPNMSPTPFKLTQVEIIKDEKASKDTGAMAATKDAATATGSAVATGATKTADAVTGKDPQDKTKDIELHVSTATTANVDLDSEVNHKVELVGMMNSNDVNAAKKADSMGTKTPLLFKATSVKSIADKCQ